jgi:hypothetical protein
MIQIYGFGDYLWLLILTAFVIFFLHQIIGGILNVFWRGIFKRHAIAVTLKDLP